MFVIRDPISLLNIDKTLFDTFVENEKICARIDGREMAALKTGRRQLIPNRYLPVLSKKKKDG